MSQQSGLYQSALRFPLWFTKPFQDCPLGCVKWVWTVGSVKDNYGPVSKTREYRQALETSMLNPVMVSLCSREVLAESPATLFVHTSGGLVCDGYEQETWSLIRGRVIKCVLPNETKPNLQPLAKECGLSQAKTCRQFTPMRLKETL